MDGGDGVLIQGVGTFVPTETVALEDLQEKLGLNRFQKDIFTRFHNLKRIPVAREHTVKEMLKTAIRDLQSKLSFDPSSIDTVIYCHTIQQVSVFPTNLVNEVVEEMGFTGAEAFSLTMQNCASSLTALDLVRKLFPDSKTKRTLVLTGEKAFSPSVQLIPHTTIMGDAACAILLGNEGLTGEILAVEQKTLGQFSDGVGLDSAAIKAFEEAYVPTLVEVIHRTLAKAQVTLEEVKWFAPHNINMTSWRKVALAIPYPLKQIYLKHLPERGHCFCSDVFLNYRSLKDEGAIGEKDCVVLASVGLGATFAAAVVRG